VVDAAFTSRDRIEDLWRVHNGAEAKADRLGRADGWFQTRTWIDPEGRQLSDRIWRQRAAVRGRIDTILKTGIARGTNALEVARGLEQYLNPGLAPTRIVRGSVLRLAPGQPRSIVTATPGLPRIAGQTTGYGGSGSYPARRLARTEITRAHGRAEVLAASAVPGMGVRWRLSPSHPERDICDKHAGHDIGFGRGVYFPSGVPEYPAHPHCLCSLSRVPMLNDDEIVRRLRDRYQLGEIDPEPPVVPPIVKPPAVKKPRAARKPKAPPAPSDFVPPEWAEHAAALRRESLANLTEKDLRAAGAPIRREYHKRLSASRHQIVVGRQNKAAHDFHAARRNAESKTNPVHRANALKDQEAAQQRWIELGNEAAAIRSDTALSVLREARPGYGQSTANLRFNPNGQAEAQRLLSDQRRYLPREWFDDFAASDLEINTAIVPRGFHRRVSKRQVDIMISGNDEAHRVGTATHELLHLREGQAIELRRLEQEFYERRTKGEKLTWMGDGYRKDEVSRPDQFKDLYMGKDYRPRDGAGANWEIASMGVESLLTPSGHRVDLGADFDYLEFIFGVLTGT
jgi:hypothetical protein